MNEFFLRPDLFDESGLTIYGIPFRSPALLRLCRDMQGRLRVRVTWFLRWSVVMGFFVGYG